MQYFKGDDLEVKMNAVGDVILSALSFQKDLFFEGCFDTSPLGDILYQGNFSPLSNAIVQTVFRQSFNEIFTAFAVAGSFESYIAVFQKIFGSDVSVNFTVSGPGLLTIAIVASGVDSSDFITRYLVGNVYNYDTMVTQDGYVIEFQVVKGFQTQYELEQMLFELVPDGVSTTITLTLS